jgi:hypothetical protein
MVAASPFAEEVENCSPMEWQIKLARQKFVTSQAFEVFWGPIESIGLHKPEIPRT